MKRLQPLVFSVALACSAAAQAASVSGDWSATLNPNPAGWSYGWSASLGSTFNLYTGTAVINGVDFWTTDNDIDPNVSHNGSGATQVVGGGTLQPGQSAFHPGPLDEYSIYRWTASTAGAYDINAFFDDPGNAPTTDVHVLVDEVVVFSGFVDGAGGSALAVLSALALAAGSTVDFVVGSGGNGYFFDTTRIDASVVAAGVPEPASAALVLLALGATAATRRKAVATAAGGRLY